MRAQSDTAGFIPNRLASVKPVLRPIREAGIRLVTNSGGMNPLACQDAFIAMAQDAGVAFRVAVITGDDLLGREEEIRASGIAEMFTGAPMPGAFRSLNAYLGATAIARALDAGADVVITGRVVDSALVLGPLMHEFGWSPTDYDKLAQGSLAGHVIECGAQGTGGLTTDWELVADGWADMGFPIIDCEPDGRFTVSKPAGKGGRITPDTMPNRSSMRSAIRRRTAFPMSPATSACCRWSRSGRTGWGKGPRPRARLQGLRHLA